MGPFAPTPRLPTPTQGGASSSYTISHQDAVATFDALNRTLSITDSGASGSAPMAIAYQYDKAGNVRHMAATYRSLDAQGNIGSTDVGQDYWYSYDAMNRFLVTKGSLSGTAGASGTTIVRGASGTAITYDLAGRRATATTESAGLIWHGYKATLKTNHNVFYYVDIDEAETDNTSYTWLQTDVAYSGTTVEHYSYSADGDLSGVTVASQVAHAIWASAPTPDEMGSAVTRATYTRDAMGRVTQLTEYDATGATAVYSRSAVYDNSSRLTSDTVSTLRSDGDFTTSTTYSYGAGGLLASASADASKGGIDGDAPDTVTTYSYAWWDGAQQSLVTADPDDSATNTTSTYTYDGSGHIASVAIEGAHARTVSFVTDGSGMVLQRTEAVTGTSAQPRELHYYYEGIRVGDVSNNGTSDIDYVASIARQTEAAGGGPFINGHSHATPYADFDQSYDPINGLNVQSTSSSYTVSDGDTLQSIAATVWGDASLWYLIADANGLNSASTLISGQSLAIPNKVTNLHNDSSTFRVYDPNKAMGDLSPGAPKPPKAHGCGVVGQILMVAIAVAVTALLRVPVAGFITGALGGTAGAATAGAIAGAAGSAASQAFGVATGVQSKFSWKGVAMSAISGAIGGGIGKAGGIFAQSGFVGGAARGLAGSVLSQGIGVATGLQDKFDWAGVAGAALGGGLSSALGGRLGGLNQYAAQTISGAAGALANAGARSLIDGTDFGDNLMAALPDVIGSTIGNMIAGAVSGDGELSEDKQAAIAAEKSAEFAAEQSNPTSARQFSYSPVDDAAPAQAGGQVIPPGDITVIRPNETIQSLADRYGVPADRIAALNHTSVNATLRPGQHLFIAPSWQIGLDYEENTAIYARDFRNLSQRWSSLTPAQRSAEALSIINRRLEASDVPGVLGFRQTRTNGDPNYDVRTHTIFLDTRLFNRNLSYLELRELATTIYHEARHAEQYFRLIQLHFGRGFPRESILTSVGRTPSSMLINAAARNPLPLSDYRAPYFRAIQSSYYGPGDGERETVLTHLEGNDRTYYARYRNLPEEQDSWRVAAKVQSHWRR